MKGDTTLLRGHAHQRPGLRAWFFLLCVGLAGVAALAGCRHAPGPAAAGTSAVRFVVPPPAAPSTGQTEAAPETTRRLDYREAQLIEPAVLPVYPPRALAAKAGATTVGVHVTVDEGGSITDIRSSIWVVSLPGPYSGDFRAAVDAAVRQWRFVPAETIEFEEGAQEGRPSAPLKREKVATEFDLAFDFAPGGGPARVQVPPR